MSNDNKQKGTKELCLMTIKSDQKKKLILEKDEFFE